MRVADRFPRVLAVLSTDWDTSAGWALRSLVWSLYNGKNSVPLWHAITDLDDGLRAEFCALLAEGLEAQAGLIKHLLDESGEMIRRDTVPLQWDDDG